MQVPEYEHQCKKRCSNGRVASDGDRYALVKVVPFFKNLERQKYFEIILNWRRNLALGLPFLPRDKEVYIAVKTPLI